MKKLLFIALLFCLPAFGQVTVSPFVTPNVQFLSNSGTPLAGGKVCTFAAGSTTPQTSYSDSAGSVANTNPVVLDSAGRASIWLTTQTYKIVVAASTSNSQCSPSITSTDNVSWATMANTVTSLVDTGALTVQASAAATSGANQSSPLLCVQGNYWTGAASASDKWCLQDLLGTGSNPTTTLNVTHGAGSSGTAGMNLASALTVTGASTLSSVTAKNLESIRFADQFAIGSSTGGIQEAINDLPAGGGTVVIPPNYTAACTVGVTTGSKIIEFRGYGRTSVISGSGITILLLSSPGSAVRNLKIIDPVGNAATIGIKLDNGLTGMTEWVIEDVFLQGTANLGTGIGTNFALIGKIRGGEIQSWNIGIQLTGPDNGHKSNAVEIDGTDVHVNVTGIDIPNSVDDVFIHSSTIEGNQLGISWGAGGNGGSMRLTSNHFENNLGGTPTNVQFNGAGCTVSGFGNTFGAGRVGGDYFAVSGAVNLNSYGETLNEGVHNDGTGVFIVNDPPFTPNFAGTGIVLFRQAGISQQVSPVGNNLFWILGWAWLQVDQIIKIKEAGAPGAGTAGFDWLWADSSAHRLKTNPNNSGNTTVALFTDNLGVFSSGGTITPALYASSSNCSSPASPAVCAAAPAGSIAIANPATTIQVNTTAVTANSQIFVQEDSSLGTKLGVTCNATLGRTFQITARVAATSFTITASATPAANSACLSYSIVN